MKKQLLTIGLATLLGATIISCDSNNNEAEEGEIILATEEVSTDEREPLDALEAEDPVELADEDDLDDLNDAIEEVGKAYESAAKEVGKAYEKAGKEYEKALKESQKEYDKAMQDAQNAMKGLY